MTISVKWNKLKRMGLGQNQKPVEENGKICIKRERNIMAAKKAIVKPVVKSAAKPTEAAVKVEAPKTASVKAEDKATTPEKPVKAEEKKEEPAAAKKETAKKAPAKKDTAKKDAEKEAPAKKAELKTELHVQFADQSLTEDDLVKIAKDVWKYDLNQKVSDLKSIELYVKPEERRAYYVINKEFTGSFGI